MLPGRRSSPAPPRQARCSASSSGGGATATLLAWLAGKILVVGAVGHLRVSRRPFPVLGRPFEGSLPPVKGRPVWMRRKEKHRCHSRRKHGPCCRSRLDSVLAGTGIAAGAANAANWNILSNLHYPFFPECNTHMNAYEAGYGTQTCKGEYTVNKSNYMFTQDNADACPALGKVEVAMLSP